jgi:hypothetical protein
VTVSQIKRNKEEFFKTQLALTVCSSHDREDAAMCAALMIKRTLCAALMIERTQSAALISKQEEQGKVLSDDAYVD